ncbi:unnamed protein product, partial [Nesidiocoris tenuis]
MGWLQLTRAATITDISLFSLGSSAAVGRFPVHGLPAAVPRPGSPYVRLSDPRHHGGSADVSSRRYEFCYVQPSCQSRRLLRLGLYAYAGLLSPAGVLISSAPVEASYHDS